MRKYVPFLMVVGAMGVLLCAGESFAAPKDGLKELAELTKLAEETGQTASKIAGIAGLALGGLYAWIKQNPWHVGSAIAVALVAWKGIPTLITSAMVI
jgi:hypothetical protein